MDIAIINMPFASLNHPSFPAAQFKACLTRENISSRVFELNFLLARMTGVTEYENMALQNTVPIPLSCWFFKEHAFKDSQSRSIGDLKNIYAAQKNNTFVFTHEIEKSAARLKDEIIPAYLDACVEKILSYGVPAAAAFTCSYFQFLPAAALARRLKERVDSIKILFGGAEFRDYMGRALMEPLDFIHAVSIGEADDTFVRLAKSCISGLPPIDCQGILYRNESNEIVLSKPAVPVDIRVIENNPVPDFTDYLKELESIGPDNKSLSNIYFPIEASRGCEKGEHFHCAFCGLNDLDRAARKKSPQGVLKEIFEYKKLYPQIKRLHFTDNLIPQDYFKTLLPDLKKAAQKLDLSFFCEVRTTIRRRDLKLLSECGFKTVQPGIESLSTNILTSMRKGVTMIKNIHFLKMCREYDIYPNWNFLVHVPGEKESDYAGICRLIPYLVHLAPPLSNGHKVSMQPFSPYWKEYFDKGDWAEHAEPEHWYSILFPPEFDIFKIAYFYNARWKDVLEPFKLEPLKRLLDLWRNLWRVAHQRPGLEYESDPQTGFVTVTDTRSLAKQGIWEFDKKESIIYKSMDDPVTPKRILGLNQNIFKDTNEIILIAAQMVRLGLAVCENNKYLGLACGKAHKPGI